MTGCTGDSSLSVRNEDCCDCEAEDVDSACEEENADCEESVLRSMADAERNTRDK